MNNVLSEVELYLLKVLLAEASSPQVKAWALKELSNAYSGTTNGILKAILEAAAAFLNAPAAPAA